MEKTIADLDAITTIGLNLAEHVDNDVMGTHEDRSLKPAN